MDLMKNLRWVCRVCAVNIKRRRSVASRSAVPIFGTATINEKLNKYLDIHAELNDHLPKSICSECFKKIEWIHNFAQTAKKTQHFFMEFISISQDSQLHSSELATRYQSEFASFALLQVAGSPARSMDDLFLAHRLQNRLNLSNNPPIGNTKANFAVASHMQRSVSKQKSSIAHTNPLNFNGNNLEQKRRNLKALLNQSTPAQPSINRQPILRTAEIRANSVPPLRVVSVPPEMTIQQNFRKDSVIYDERLNLGRVIKDMDLLKLILKALKWPYTNDNLLVQIQRLKDTPFRDVILDQNLLQDTDLMQILNTILSPILLKQQNAPTPILPPLVSYKIPADLSVHLITEELEDIPKPVAKKPRKRYTRIRPKVIQNTIPIEIPSDDSIQMFEVSIDPSLYFAADSSTPENSNSSESQKKCIEAKQLEKLRRKQKRKEAHVKLHLDKDVVQENVLVTPSIVPQTEKETEQLDKTEVKGIEVDQKKVTNVITGYISGDDEFWAELRVSESPDCTITETENSTISLQIKSEPHSTNNEDKIVNSVCQDPIEQRTMEEETVQIKKEITEMEIEEEKIQKEPLELSLPEAKESPTRKKGGRKRKAASLAEKSTKLENITLAESTESQQPVKPNKSKALTNNSLPISTRKSERKLIAAKSCSTTNRKITRSVSVAPPVMSLRNSNLRKRICKQCGMSFTKINDFMTHRKLHIQS